jgi:protein-tyrosine phosphatase
MLPPHTLEEVPITYLKIAHAGCMREVFTTIANAPEGVLFHCTAGKDRSGVVSAILLALAGVADEDIIYDYTISRELNKERLEAFLAAHPEIDREVVLANEKTMDRFLQMLREKHGSIEEYLLDMGLTEDEIQKLKNKLIL